VRLYRITRNNPPTERDMTSHWDLGRRPALPRDEAAYREVSTFDTPEAAAAKALARNLGDYIAELEVSDETPTSRNPRTGHVGLAGMMPGELLGCVQGIRRVDEVPGGAEAEVAGGPEISA
jgi:hypothetical protein